MCADSEDSTDHETTRSFTCIECGYAVERAVPLLRSNVSEVCVNCGGYAVHMGDSADLEAAGRDAATMLTDIGHLTERQAEAYVYRELLGFDRGGVATAMGTTKSNVDNLQRTAREKITEAKQTVEVLNELCEGE